MKSNSKNKSWFKYSFTKYPENLRYSDNTGLYYNVLLFITGKASLQVCGESKLKIGGGEAVFLPANTDWTLTVEKTCQISSLYYRDIKEPASLAYLNYLLSIYNDRMVYEIYPLTMCEPLTEFSEKIRENSIMHEKIYGIFEYDCFVILSIYYPSAEVIKFFHPLIKDLYLTSDHSEKKRNESK